MNRYHSPTDAQCNPRFGFAMAVFIILLPATVIAFSPSHHKSILLGAQSQRRHQLYRLYYRDDVANKTDEILDTNIVDTTIEQTNTMPKTNGIYVREAYDNEVSTNRNNVSKKSDKSAQRLLKAKRLLEMAQISPSQRLEIMQQESQKTNNNGQQPVTTTNSNENGINSNTPTISNIKEDTTTTVVPMGSYSMRFGGSGSLEEELWEMTEMRMADTFDSFDNSVDLKSSLLPGGRWVNGEGDKVDSSSSATSSKEGKQLTSTTSQSKRELNGQVAEPSVRYDPVAAEKLLFLQPTKWLVRNVQIAFPFAFWVAGVLLDTALGNERSNRTNRAKQLNSIIASMGPALIKAGQALASRPDLLPSEYLDELQKLQDNVPTYSNEIAFKIVEEELGQKFSDVFELVEPEPIAAASIGQVYKGRLVSNGQTVAIKIQRPKTEEIVALDLYVLRWWAGKLV